MFDTFLPPFSTDIMHPYVWSRRHVWFYDGDKILSYIASECVLQDIYCIVTHPGVRQPSIRILDCNSISPSLSKFNLTPFNLNPPIHFFMRHSFCEMPWPGATNELIYHMYPRFYNVSPFICLRVSTRLGPAHLHSLLVQSILASHLTAASIYNTSLSPLRPSPSTSFPTVVHLSTTGCERGPSAIWRRPLRNQSNSYVLTGISVSHDRIPQDRLRCSNRGALYSFGIVHLTSSYES